MEKRESEGKRKGRRNKRRTKKAKEGDKMQLMREENVHPSITTEPKWDVKQLKTATNLVYKASL